MAFDNYTPEFYLVCQAIQSCLAYSMYPSPDTLHRPAGKPIRVSLPTPAWAEDIVL